MFRIRVPRPRWGSLSHKLIVVVCCFQAGLFSVRSPLLVKYWVESSPPLCDMLKLSSLSEATSDLRVEGVAEQDRQVYDTLQQSVLLPRDNILLELRCGAFS